MLWFNFQSCGFHFTYSLQSFEKPTQLDLHLRQNQTNISISVRLLCTEALLKSAIKVNDCTEPCLTSTLCVS